MTKYKTFPSIGAFSHARSNALRNGRKSVTWRGKIKLHGTNAGIVIKNNEVTPLSRNRTLSIENDNAGFAAFALGSADFWRWAGIEGLTVTYFGEWVGAGVQRGVALNQIKEKQFAIFLIHIAESDQWISCPLTIRYHLAKSGMKIPQNVHVLDWETESFTVDLESDNSVYAFVNDVNAKVESIEKRCPWTFNNFGFEGVGEGLVFYSAYSHGTSEFFGLSFKAKGEKHRVNKSKKAVAVDFEVLANSKAFVEKFATEARFEQGYGDLFNDTAPTIKEIGKFLEWVNRDIMKESVEELAASGLTFKNVASGIAKKAVAWFKTKVEM